MDERRCTPVVLVVGLLCALAGALGCRSSSVFPDPDDAGWNGDGGGSPLPADGGFPPPVGTLFGGAAVQADAPPPPLSGGSLLVVHSPELGRLAVASDPDEDKVDVVALDPTAQDAGDAGSVLGTVALQPGDEPGRLVADAAGHVHVALRRGGAVVTIDPATQTLLARTPVCPAPRGLDYDPQTDSVIVACATGELVTLPAAGGAPTRVVRLDRDLRDVIVDGDKLYVTRFRSAEVLTLDASGAVVARTRPAPSPGFSPDVAWRAVRTPDDRIAMLHQLASDGPIDVAVPNAYGGAGAPDAGKTPGVVLPEVTFFTKGVSGPQTLAFAKGPVIDVAATADGRLLLVPVRSAAMLIVQADGTLSGTGLVPAHAGGGSPALPSAVVAVAFAPADGTHGDAVVLQQRDPAALLVAPLRTSDVGPYESIPLPQAKAHLDTGFAVFHQPVGAGLACISCHAEGGDDGHVWHFVEKGEAHARRTQSLRGGVVAGSAPYHWDGNEADLSALAGDVLTTRMGAMAKLTNAQLGVVARWLGAIPRIPARTDLAPDEVAAGKAIFEGTGGCVACHNGPKGTLPGNVDVGREAPLQVPMLLGVGDRAPYMHDGCAKTLMDRLTDTSCAGSLHGDTKSLTATDREDLVAYLESL